MALWTGCYVRVGWHVEGPPGCRCCGWTGCQGQRRARASPAPRSSSAGRRVTCVTGATSAAAWSCSRPRLGQLVRRRAVLPPWPPTPLGLRAVRGGPLVGAELCAGASGGFVDAEGALVPLGPDQRGALANATDLRGILSVTGCVRLALRQLPPCGAALRHPLARGWFGSGA